MATGWLIGVMVELDDEPVALRHFFAVGHEDRARAEWKAVDQALLIGRVAVSPVGGLEPVHAVGADAGGGGVVRPGFAAPMDDARAVPLARGSGRSGVGLTRVVLVPGARGVQA